ALALSNEHASSLEIAKWEIEGSAVELSHQATHDSLTDLPNRQFFEQHLADIIASATGGKSSSSFVLFLDLDKFKLINDTLGHKVGDLLLIEVADRLQSCLRSEDLLARMGGDEFTVIIPHCSNRSVAETVALRMIDSISRPFEIQKHRFVIGASIGMARYPNDGKSTITLLKHADAAMYKAKQAGRGRYCWYSGDVDVENQQRADLEMDIRLALDTGQFSVHYQPIISLDDGNVLSAEALLRWEHPDKGMIPPSLFIPVAEEIGAIGPIGDFVLRTSCAQVMAWRDEGIYLSQIGVNVSAMQVRDANWLATVTSALADTGLEAECLNLELTETGFADDTRSMKKTLGEVRELGICMAIDDFGTGQSSISRLKSFPVIHLKIDGSFIRDIETDKSDNALVRSIIDMAHSQGMKVTAEWVETEPQMDILRSIGCDYAQGFFISPALPAEAFLEFVRLWTLARQAVATG
ncbi:MAG: EAL domain-containing protein, partial [Armatimonadota bacterium]